MWSFCCVRRRCWPVAPSSFVPCSGSATRRQQTRRRANRLVWPANEGTVVQVCACACTCRTSTRICVTKLAGAAFVQGGWNKYRMILENIVHVVPKDQGVDGSTQSAAASARGSRNYSASRKRAGRFCGQAPQLWLQCGTPPQPHFTSSVPRPQLGRPCCAGSVACPGAEPAGSSDALRAAFDDCGCKAARCSPQLTCAHLKCL